MRVIPDADRLDVSRNWPRESHGIPGSSANRMRLDGDQNSVAIACESDGGWIVGLLVISGHCVPFTMLERHSTVTGSSFFIPSSLGPFAHSIMLSSCDMK